MAPMPNDEPRRAAPPSRQVEAMFDEVVPRYDLINGLLSLGLDRRWRRAALSAVGPRPGMRVLDLGCGTGDLVVMLHRAGARPVGLDISGAMLREARRKTNGRAGLVRASAFDLPFADASFGGAVSGF